MNTLRYDGVTKVENSHDNFKTKAKIIIFDGCKHKTIFHMAPRFGLIENIPRGFKDELHAIDQVEDPWFLMLTTHST